MKFWNPTTFSVNWQRSPRAFYTLVIKDRYNEKIHEEPRVAIVPCSFNTATVPLESFQPYTVTVIEIGRAQHQSTTSFWSPPRPPSSPALSVTAVPQRLSISWRAPSERIVSLLEYRVRICIDYSTTCSTVTLGPTTRSMNLSTPTAATYSIELWASHRYVFGDFTVDSQIQKRVLMSCRSGELLEGNS